MGCRSKIFSKFTLNVKAEAGLKKPNSSNNVNTVSTNIRPYRPEDRKPLVRFWEEVGKLEAAHDRILVRELIDNLDRPNHDPERDLFVAESSGTITGYIDVLSEPAIGRVVLQYLVHPGHRRKGISPKLVDHATERAGEIRVKKVQVNIPQDDKVGKRLFAKMGFRFVRRFLELRLDLSKAHSSQMTPDDYPCRPMMESEVEKLTTLQNRSFLDTWGFNPNTPEEINYRINRSKTSREDITFCLDDTEPIGYCWAKIDFGKGSLMGEKRGRINMLGVDPNYRGKGVGKKVLMVGLTQLRRRGVDIVDLTVDNENKAARALYQSLGFTERTSSLWYQKDLEY
jgi:mycothiol synthase